MSLSTAWVLLPPSRGGSAAERVGRIAPPAPGPIGPGSVGPPGPVGIGGIGMPPGSPPMSGLGMKYVKLSALTEF